MTYRLWLPDGPEVTSVCLDGISEWLLTGYLTDAQAETYLDLCEECEEFGGSWYEWLPLEVDE